MELPKIDALTIPDLIEPVGVFGSQIAPNRHVGSDDTLIVLMVFLYDCFE
jgi:hypothetical protein